MKSVTVRVPASDLARAMVMMREWLDLHRCEPTSFDCGTNGAEVALVVRFRPGGVPAGKSKEPLRGPRVRGREAGPRLRISALLLTKPSTNHPAYLKPTDRGDLAPVRVGVSRRHLYLFADAPLATVFVAG